MLKLLFAFLLVFTQNSFAQDDIHATGFGDIRLGKSYQELEGKIIEIDEVPDNAWFAPMTLEAFMAETDGDSTGFAGMRDTDKLISEGSGTKLIRCTFIGKQNTAVLGHKIVCAQLIFMDDLLISMVLVLDDSNISVKSKRQLLVDLEQRLGELECAYSVNFDPSPFYCSWFSEEGGEFSVSDMIVAGGGPGKTIHILIGM